MQGKQSDIDPANKLSSKARLNPNEQHDYPAVDCLVNRAVWESPLGKLRTQPLRQALRPLLLPRLFVAL